MLVIDLFAFWGRQSWNLSGKNFRLLYQFDTDYMPSLLGDKDHMKDGVVCISTSVPTQIKGKYAFESSEVWDILYVQSSLNSFVKCTLRHLLVKQQICEYAFIKTCDHSNTTVRGQYKCFS